MPSGKITNLVPLALNSWSKSGHSQWSCIKKNYLASSPSLSKLSLPSLFPLLIKVTPASQAASPNLHRLLFLVHFEIENCLARTYFSFWAKNNLPRSSVEQGSLGDRRSSPHHRPDLHQGQQVQRGLGQEMWQSANYFNQTWWLSRRTAALLSFNFSSPSIVKVSGIW